MNFSASSLTLLSNSIIAAVHLLSFGSLKQISQAANSSLLFVLTKKFTAVITREGTIKTITAAAASKIVIAYEPIWAIGTGKTATPEQAEDMCAFIRGVVSGIYDNETGNEMLILYGGSMKPSNAKELLEKPDINGGLIGGASLKADDFAAIAEAAASL